MELPTTHLVITDLLKATPAEEGGRRFVYLEASNEALDLQGETVLAKALQESSDYYLRYGNLDLDHMTQIGPRAGVADYMLYEIGRPMQVTVDGRRTFVKGEIFKGDVPVAEKANRFWESITAVSPPQRWYPSVGGSVLEKSSEVDPTHKARKTMISRVRWTNIGFSKTPVNQAVPTVSSIPFGAFAKAWGPHGLDLAKALEAGYGTDSAALTGGAALRRQSLYGVPLNYWDFRDQIASHVLAKHVAEPTAENLTEFATTHYGMSRDEAAEWVARFMGDLKSGLNKRRST